MRRIITYELKIAEGTTDLDKQVNAAIQKGFQPLMGASVAFQREAGHDELLLAQAMVKYAD